MRIDARFLTDDVTEPVSRCLRFFVALSSEYFHMVLGITVSLFPVCRMVIACKLQLYICLVTAIGSDDFRDPVSLCLRSSGIIFLSSCL